MDRPGEGEGGDIDAFDLGGDGDGMDVGHDGGMEDFGDGGFEADLNDDLAPDMQVCLCSHHTSFAQYRCSWCFCLFLFGLWPWCGQVGLVSFARVTCSKCECPFGHV